MHRHGAIRPAKRLGLLVRCGPFIKVGETFFCPVNRIDRAPRKDGHDAKMERLRVAAFIVVAPPPASKMLGNQQARNMRDQL